MDAAAMPAHGTSVLSFAPIAVTVALFLIAIFRGRATSPIARKLFQFELFPFRGLQFLHSGLIGDYVVWMILGLAALSLGFAFK
jgi:multicomponent Na+:H+ antiporter subunit D